MSQAVISWDRFQLPSRPASLLFWAFPQICQQKRWTKASTEEITWKHKSELESLEGLGKLLNAADDDFLSPFLRGWMSINKL